MNRLYYLGIFTIMIFSCNQKTELNQAELNKKIIADSIAEQKVQEERVAQKIKDSIFNAEQDKVIDNILFMISEKEAKEKITEFVEKSKRTKYSNSDDKYPFIGNYEFRDYGNNGFYYNDKLYMFKIKGKYISWEKYDSEVPKQLGYIKNVIELKYGEPTYSIDIPERYRIDNDKSYVIYSWSIGVKQIDIRLSDEGTYYRINVLIYLPTVVEMITNENEQREKIKSEKDKNVF